MDTKEAVEISVRYLHHNLFNPLPVDEYRLHPSLSAKLCRALSRVRKARNAHVSLHPFQQIFDISPKEVIFLVEAWLMSQSDQVSGLVEAETL